MIWLTLVVILLGVSSCWHAIMLAKHSDDLKIASGNFARLDQKLTETNYRLNSSYNKLFGEQTDFIKSFNERCTKNETKIEQRYAEALDAIAELEEDLTVTILAKKDN